MSMRFTSKARRGMVALAVAAGLALGVAGCGGGGGDDKKPEASASTSKVTSRLREYARRGADEPLAELKGEDGSDPPDRLCSERTPGASSR